MSSDVVYGDADLVRIYRENKVLKQLCQQPNVLLAAGEKDMDDTLNVLLTFYWVPCQTLQRVALSIPHGLDAYLTDVEFFREPQHQQRLVSQLSVYYRDMHAAGALVLVNAETLDEIQIGEPYGRQ